MLKGSEAPVNIAQQKGAAKIVLERLNFSSMMPLISIEQRE